MNRYRIHEPPQAIESGQTWYKKDQFVERIEVVRPYGRLAEHWVVYLKNANDHVPSVVEAAMYERDIRREYELDPTSPIIQWTYEEMQKAWQDLNAQMQRDVDEPI